MMKNYSECDNDFLNQHDEENKKKNEEVHFTLFQIPYTKFENSESKRN